MPLMGSLIFCVKIRDIYRLSMVVSGKDAECQSVV